MPTPDFTSRDGQDAVDGIFSRTKMPVVLTDQNLFVIAASVHPRADENRIAAILERRTPSPSREFVRELTANTYSACIEVPAQPGIGMALQRWCLPVHQKAGDYFFWLLGTDQRADPGLMTSAAHFTSSMSDLGPGSALRAGARRVGDELVQALVAGGGADSLAASLLPILALIGAADRCVATIASPAGAEATAILLESTPSLNGSMFCVRGVDEILAVMPSEMVRSIIGVVSDHGSTVGIARLDSDSMARSVERADFMRLVARLPESPDVMVWEHSGSWTTLAAIDLSWDSLDLLGPGLRDLVVNRELLASTALAYLESSRVEDTTRALSIHRNTLYYRLRQIEEILGPAWDTGWKRTGVHQGLQLARLLLSLDGSHPLPTYAT